MKISKPHQRFANILNNQRVLSHPEEFLGPNWKDVLNFWIYLDTLTFEQIDIARNRVRNLDDAHINYSKNLASIAASEATNHYISHCVYVSAPGYAGFVAKELIGAHKILEQGQTLTLVPLFLEL
jgi:hypothetical protein